MMNWFNNMRIRTKLSVSFALLALTTGIVGYMGISKIRAANDADIRLYEKTTVPMGQLGDIASLFQQLRVNTRDIILARSDDERQKYIDQGKELDGQMVKLAGEYETAGLAGYMTDLFKSYETSWSTYQSKRRALIALASQGNQSDAIELLRGDNGKVIGAMEDQLKKMHQTIVLHAKETSDGNTALANNGISLMGLLTIAAIVVAIAWGLWISGLISKPIKLMVERAERLQGLCIANLGKASEAMARGDLSVKIETGTEPLEIKTKDELGMLAASINGIIKRTQATVVSFDQARETLRSVVDETTRLTLTAQEGRLSERGQADKFQGGYRDLVNGINGTLDAITSPITEASGVLQRIAERDLNVRMHGSYRGDFVKLKDAINQAV